MIEPVKTLSKYVAVLSATLLLATPAIAQQNIIGGTTGVPEGTAGFEKWMMFRDHVNEQSNNALKVTAMVLSLIHI